MTCTLSFSEFKTQNSFNFHNRIDTQFQTGFSYERRPYVVYSFFNIKVTSNDWNTYARIVSTKISTTKNKLLEDETTLTGSSPSFFFRSLSFSFSLISFCRISSYALINSGQVRLSSGSQVLSLCEKPFHFKKYSTWTKTGNIAFLFRWTKKIVSLKCGYVLTLPFFTRRFKIFSTT